MNCDGKSDSRNYYRRPRSGYRRRYTYGRKKYYRARASRDASQIVPRTMRPTVMRGLPSAFPPSILVKLRYNATFAAITNPGTDQQFNLNSLFDPDRTGAGHQPYSFDQWTAIYNRYRVYGVKWRVIFTNTSSGNVPQVGVGWDNVTSSQATSATFWERPTTVSKILSEDTGGQNTATMQGYIPLQTLYGITKTQLLAGDEYSSDVASSPAEFAIMHVVTQDIFLGAATTVNYQVQLVYYAQFFDWQDPSGS